MPVIPSQGSVGAIGDLAPLAHLISALMGYGRIDVAGDSHAGRRRARDSSASSRSQLGPKEGLALINGTQASTAHRARRLVPGRARVRRRDRRRRAVGRCAQGLGQAVRPAHFGASRPARPDPRRRRDRAGCSTAARSSTSHVTLRPGAGPLQLPLPAAGDGRRARPARQCRAHADHRSRRGDRQSDRLSRRGQRDLRRQFPCPAGRLRRRHRSPWRLCEVGSISERRTRCWSIPR